jgi:hypothetical protein
LITSAALLAVAACSSARDITRQSDGLLTSGLTRTDYCTAQAAADPLEGTLEGQAGTTDPVWILAVDGGRLSVAWPRGFSVRFEADAVLYDETGAPVAKAGDHISLGQVHRSGHSGTPEDPFLASGQIFGVCFPPVL